jgi:hypothetical protein
VPIPPHPVSHSTALRAGDVCVIAVDGVAFGALPDVVDEPGRLPV